MSDHQIHIKINPDVGESNPLNGVIEEHARQFRDKYNLPIEEDVFIRGVLAVQARDGRIIPPLKKIIDFRQKNPGDSYPPIELKIGEHIFTKLEVEVLKNAWTRTRKETLYHLSRLHWLLIVACIFAAITQGWDQAAMAGAAIEVMIDLGKNITTTPSYGSTPDADNNDFDLNQNIWLFGFLVGAPFIFGAPIALLITDPLTEFWQFGRRGAICVAGLFSFISVIGSASIHRWRHFLAFRILLGVGMAGKASIVPILLSETSPKNVRGILLVCWQLSVAFGLAAGSVANMSVYHLDTHSSWRYMFLAAFIPALLLFSLVLFSPESPRWLLKKSGTKGNDKNDIVSKRRVREALKSHIQLRGEPTPILAAGELYLIYKSLIREQDRFDNKSSEYPQHEGAKVMQGHQQPIQTATNNASIPGGPTLGVHNYPPVGVINHVSWLNRWRLMLRSGPMRRANFAAAAVMIAQQLCGINLLAFLADTFLRNSIFQHYHTTSLAENTQLLGFSLGFGILNFVATIPAMRYIDKSDGRRTLLNWSFPCMALSLLVSALILLVPEDPATGKARRVVIGIHYFSLAAFTTAYSIGEGPAAFVISAEVFPLVNRELGMSLAVCWNYSGAGILAVFAPVMMKVMGQFGILMLFSGMNLLAWFACYWLVPNTGNEDLEAVFEQLEVPTSFAFTHTLKTLRRKAWKPVGYCFNSGPKKWSEYEYGTAMDAYEAYKLERMQSDGVDSKRADNQVGVEMIEQVASEQADDQEGRPRRTTKKDDQEGRPRRTTKKDDQEGAN